MNRSLQRFEEAHKQHFQNALKEIKNGRKTSHWMWFIFPQLAGLGYSETSMYYAIEDLSEAKAFMDHPMLGANLKLISATLLDLQTNDATLIFGNPDDIKLKSSMTLFSKVPGSSDVFLQVLQKYFNGQTDEKTIQLLS